MNDVQKSMVAAGVVISAIAAAVVGANTRSNRDLGQEDLGGLESATTRGLLASKDNSVDVPAGDYFYELSDKVRKEYVEPGVDDQKMAIGAVRGMVGSLSDPKSTFMAKDEFQAYLRARQGEYSGIGVDVALEFDKVPAKKDQKVTAGEPESSETTTEEALAAGLQIPKVVVTNVVPGGPADKAGVKVGDVVYEVDNHWVANGDDVAAFRLKQQAFMDKKLDKKDYFELRNEIRKKTERALMPIKVREKLIAGSGAIHITWLREGKKVITKIEKGTSSGPQFSISGNTIVLPLNGTTGDQLTKAVAGKSEITIDLRHNVNGDFNVMRKALASLAPSGKYGSITTDKKEVSTPLSIEKGNASAPRLTLLVDQSTGGAAEILALALSKKAGAKLTGGAMSGDRSVLQVVELPDGSGYTLVTGEYSDTTSISSVAKGGQK